MKKKRKKIMAAEVRRKVADILKLARRDPRFQRGRERNALIEAVRYGRTEIAKALLKYGVDPNAAEPGGKSALWYAAQSNQSDLIRLLVASGARLPDDVLMGPVHDGDAVIVRFLIRHGANVNCVAVFTRYNNKWPRKHVLLAIAIEEIATDKIVDWTLRESRAANPPKRRAALPSLKPARDYEEIPLMLIKAGARVDRLASDYPDREGCKETLLALAAENGLVRTVKAMLAAGAPVNKLDTCGRTALYHAAWLGQRDVARLLLSAGADPSLQSRDGSTAITLARTRGFPDLVDELEKHARQR